MMDIQTIALKNDAAHYEVGVPQDIGLFEELDKARTNFVANILHELKTPVSTIKMCLQLLKDSRIGHMNPQQLKLLKYISDDSERLLKLTSELLNHTQIETGRMLLNLVPVSPGSIVACAINAVKFPAMHKHVVLQVKASTGLPKVLADMEKTARVLVNFLSNSLRYSSGKKIVIHLYEENNRVNFSVQDFGEGIKKCYCDRLFERHFQVPANGCKTGSGLGLAISKEIIEAQHGEIRVESVLGEGSIFSFTLPCPTNY